MRLLLVLPALLAACAHLQAPSTPRPTPSLVDPGFLDQYAATGRFRLGHPSAITPSPDGATVLFLRSGARTFVQDLYELSLATGQERVLLTAEQLLGGAQENLTPEEKARRERMRQAARGIASFSLSSDGKRILVPLSGQLFVFERESAKVRTVGNGGAIDPRFSPDAKSIAFVRDGDLYVADVASGKERRLTTRKSPDIENGLAEFVAQEEMGRMAGYWWSPDSRSLAYQETDTSGVERMYIAEPAAPQRSPQAWPYPRAGTSNAKVRVGVVAVTGGATTWLKWDDAFPYLTHVRWSKNAPLTVLVQDRAQRTLQVLAADPKSGKTRVLHKETDEVWLNLDPEMPVWLPDGSAFLWTTERGGDWQLELRSKDGELQRALTPPGYGYRGFVALDGQEVLLRAAAEPTEVHLARVPLAGGEVKPPFTSGAGVHGAIFGGGIWIHTEDLLDGTRRFTVKRGDERVAELASVAEPVPFPVRPEILTLDAPDELRAVVIRPRDFDRDLVYPVVLWVYGGPHYQTVTARASAYVFQQWIANQGFVVVSIDGRGTPSRGRAFERAIFGKLADVPVEDQVKGLQQLARRLPEVDASRVGVFGWSFGGYLSALLTLKRPDVISVGVAGAPVADWRDYDTHYTERYLGMPDANAAAYEQSSVLTFAKELRRPLLLVHGSGDDNVTFAHSLKLSDALFRAGKRHDFLPLAGQTHMVVDPAVAGPMYGRIVEYLADALGGPEESDE